MRRAILLLTILLGSTVVFGQKDGKSIIDKFTKQLEAYPSISATFDFSLENKEAEISDTNSGKLVVKGDMYRLDMLGIEIYSNGKTSYSYMPSTNEVNITNVDNEEAGAVDPAKMFVLYKEGMNAKLLNTHTRNNLKEYEIELTPEKEENFKKVVLFITSDNKLNKAITYANDGNVYTIKVKEMDTSKNFDDNYFTFDKTSHPDVDVIDMR